MRRKVTGLAAIAAVAALALAGCSGNSGSALTGGEGTNPQPRDKIADGGELKLSISSLPVSWNTMSVDGNNADLSSRIGLFILPQFLVYNTDGSFEPNPSFLESYELKTGKDAPNGKQEVILHLNPKAVWGDGTPITWKDFEATFKACGPKGDDGFECASRDAWAFWEKVSQGEKESDVVIDFSEVFPDWSSTIGASPAKGIADAKTFNTGWEKPNNDWFSGPYKVASVDEAQQVVTLEKNDKWWGDAPKLDTITWRVLDPAAAAAAFANSEIDVLEGIISAQQYSQAAARADAEIRRAGGLTWRHFTFNSESKNLGDPKVRVALARGVDRAAITESDLAGIPDIVPADQVLQNHFFMPDQKAGYQKNGEEYNFDPEKAGKELDEAGWKLKDGATYRTNEAGDTLSLEYLMMPDISTSKNEGELLQAQMKDIGVEVKFRNVETKDFFPDVAAGKFDVTAFAWQGTPYPMANINQLYGCGNNLAKNGGSNFSNYCIDGIEDLAAKVATETDNAKRIQLTNEADKLIWANNMTLPLYQRVEMTAVPKNLANYGAWGMSSVAAENVGYMK